MTTPTICFEIEIALDGSVVPYEPATRTDPASGGFVEDLEVIGLGIVALDRTQKNPSHPNGVWKTTSLLDGVDLKAPAIQKLFANILAMHDAEAQAAVMEAE